MAPLDVAALQIATIEYPDLSIESFLVLLDSHATEFGERIDGRVRGEEFVELLNEYLFEELGFQGNSDDYYNASNSCLNDVLTHRLGIPISLSLVYMEIGRRLGRSIHGIGLPGHFLVMYDEPDFKAYLDPFHGGQMLSADECFSLAREATGLDLADDADMLQPVSKRHILVRMLNNLRAVYFRQSNTPRAVNILDLLIEASPDSAEEYKQRGVCLAQLQRFEDARADLELYLTLSPGASDRMQVSAELQRIKRVIELLE